MTDHHNEELLGLLDRIKEFLRTQVYPLESDFLRRPFRDLTPTLNATREKVRFERKLELSGEGHRFYDLIRWSGFWGGTPNDYAERVLDAYLSYEAPKIPSGAFSGTNFNRGEDELLPLPQGQIDLKPGVLTQNFNY